MRKSNNSFQTKTLKRSHVRFIERLGRLMEEDNRFFTTREFMYPHDFVGENPTYRQGKYDLRDELKVLTVGEAPHTCEAKKQPKGFKLSEKGLYFYELIEQIRTIDPNYKGYPPALVCLITYASKLQSEGKYLSFPMYREVIGYELKVKPRKVNVQDIIRNYDAYYGCDQLFTKISYRDVDKTCHWSTCGFKITEKAMKLSPLLEKMSEGFKLLE